MLCQSCQQSNASLDFLATKRILCEVHEGVWLGQCVRCAQLYLRYYVENRDDSLDYFCQITAQQCDFFLDLHGNELLATAVRELVRSSRVLFIAPWVKEWTDGGRVLADVRPW